MTDSPDSGPASLTAATGRSTFSSHVRWRGLTAKQALATLVLALVLGLAGSAANLFVEWRDTRNDLTDTMTALLAVVEGAASNAAYQLNGGLAQRVVEGVAGNPAINRVVLKDNFGNTLGDLVRPPSDIGPLDDLAGWLFGDVVSYDLPLMYGVAGREKEAVGNLTLDLSPVKVADGFFQRAVVAFVTSMVTALGMALAVVLVSYMTVTRPILRFARLIDEVDPAYPGATQVTDPGRHRGDEIGVAMRSLEALLQASQTGLEARDAAEADLRELTRTLEDRVTARTRELWAVNTRLAEEKAETERAYGDLGRANSLILESLEYARKIQTAVLPDPEALAGSVAEVRVSWEPLQTVSGDYYWMERQGALSVIVIADCTGHGVPGAFMTLVVASVLDQVLHAELLLDPAEALTRLDQLIRSRLRQDRPESTSDDGLEAAICVYDRESGLLRYAGAGVPLLVLRGGTVQETRATRVALGYRTIPPGRPIKAHCLTVVPGDRFYLMTDGYPDTMGAESQCLLGRRRLGEMLTETAGLPLGDQLAAIEAAVEAYRGEEAVRDDRTLIGFRPV